VAFTPPANDGGAAVTGYTVTATDVTNPANGGQTASGAGSPINVTGLTNGDSYTFTVTATNSVGTGPASAASNAVTPLKPATVPSAPTIGTATAGDAEATVTFTPPANDGGAAITGYTVTATDVTNPANGGQTAAGTGSPLTVTGLTNGDTYTFTVRATNSVGTGPASDPSNAVTPATVPGAPTIGTATAGDAEATVTFTPPVDNGGAEITGYTVTATEAATVAIAGITTLDLDTQAASGTTSPITVTGLTNGVTYTFTVTATNAAGTGAASGPSNAVTPATVPDAPTIGTAAAGDGDATVSFTPPVDNGGSDITRYTVTATDVTTPGNGGQTATGTSSPITITGLTNGDAYTFTVTATNAVGDGVASEASNAVTPAKSAIPIVPVVPVEPQHPGLAATGSDLTMPLGLVGLLLAAGMAVLGAARVRRGRQSQNN
jgi:predicted RNA-binding protein with TRAM domain